MKRQQKRVPSLLIRIAISAGILTVISVIGKLTIYKDYAWDYWKEPLLAVLFEATEDGVYPWELIRAETWGYGKNQEVLVQSAERESTQANDKMENTNIQTSFNHKENSSQEKIEVQDTDNDGVEQSKTEQVSSVQDASIEEEKEIEDEKEIEKEIEDENTPSELELTLGAVDQEYFDDALFIGDSRTVGLSEYSYLDNATYYCDVGMSVYTVFDKKIVTIGKKTMTIEKALKKKKFKKIYIMLGINELGTGTAKTFVKKYSEMLERIKELQPDAYIIIESIMNVGKKLSDDDKIFTNERIQERNAQLEQLQDGEKVFYVDVNMALCDENGYLPEDYTFDSIHLKGKYYDKWADYLLNHAVIVKEE